MTDLAFSVSLEDHVSPAARAAEKSLHGLETELKTSKKSLSEYQAQLSLAKSTGDIAGYRKYSALVAQARADTFRLGDAVQQAKSSLGSLPPALESVTVNLGGLAEAAGVAALAVGAALIGMAAEAVKAAIEVNEVNERLTATFEALGDKPGSGAKTLDFVNKLATQLPQSRDELAKWTKQFESFGVTDLGELRQQIHATASAQALMGDEGAAAYEKVAKRVADAARGGHQLKLGKGDVLGTFESTGIRAEDVARRMGMSLRQFDAQLKGGAVDAQAFGNALSGALIDKGRGPLRAMGNELGTLKEKAAEAINHLFDGIDISPLTDAITSFIQLGDQGVGTSGDIHHAFESALQGVINWLGNVVTEAEIVFLSIEIWVLKNKSTIKSTFDAAKKDVDQFLQFAGKVESVFERIASAVLKVDSAIARLPGAGKALGFVASNLAQASGIGGAIDLGKGISAANDVSNALGSRPAPAHAQGGMVHRPAAGEFFASVAPGEMIVPRRQTEEIRGGIGMHHPFADVANTNAGESRGVHIDHLNITIDAPHGVTDATALSVTGLTLALERLQLASGR